MVRVWGSLPFLYNRWHWMCIKSTLAIRCLAGFGLCLITKTQAAVSIASAHPQSGSRPTRCGALSPFRPRSPGCYGLRFKKVKCLLSCKKLLDLTCWSEIGAGYGTLCTPSIAILIRFESNRQCFCFWCVSIRTLVRTEPGKRKEFKGLRALTTQPGWHTKLLPYTNFY